VLGMLVVCDGKDAGPGGLNGSGCAVLDVGGGMQAQDRVPVLCVVPAEERLAGRRSEGLATATCLG